MNNTRKQTNIKEHITFKQSQFARLVAEEGMSNTQAYINAYKPSKNATKKINTRNGM